MTVTSFLKKFIIYFIGILLITVVMDYFYYGDFEKALPTTAFSFIKLATASLLVTFISIGVNSKRSSKKQHERT